MMLTPVDQKRNRYQIFHLLCLMYVWALTWRESCGDLMVDAFEFDGQYIGCIPYKDDWWEDHHGLET